MDKDTRTAILFFGIIFTATLGMYLLTSLSDNLAIRLLVLTIATTAVGTYIVNLIFIGRLLAESRTGRVINRSALRISLATALYPLLVLVLYYIGPAGTGTH